MNLKGEVLPSRMAPQQAVGYPDRNPVREGWSSYDWYRGERDVPDPNGENRGGFSSLD